MGFATEQQALESDPAFESFHERLASDQARLGDRQRALGRVKLKKRRLPASRRGNFLQKLDCLRPWQQAKSPFYNDELLTQPLERGRVCAVHTCQMGPRGFCLLVGSATCSQFSCGLNVRDGVATAAEALTMVEHGRRVLKQVAHAAGRRVEAYERLEFLDGARHGSEEGHLLGILLAERLRRLTSAQFGVPLPRLQLSEHFLAMHSACHPLPCSGLPSTVHCDEAISGNSHYSSVLWLSAHEADFLGGELKFHNGSRPQSARQRPWLSVVPAAGRAAFFSSGWEAIHGIAEVERGERWAMTAVFTLGAPDPAASSPGSEAFRHCTHPSNPMSYSFCRAGWSTLFGYTLDPSAGS